MIARDNSISNFIKSQILPSSLLMAGFRTRPERFDSYEWITQNEKVVPIKEFTDSHLVNTYKMLLNTLIFAKKKY